MCSTTFFKSILKQIQGLRGPLGFLRPILFGLAIIFFEPAMGFSPGRIHVVEGAVTYTMANGSDKQFHLMTRKTKIKRSMIIHLEQGARISFRTLKTCKASIVGPADIITPTNTINSWRVEGASFHWKCRGNRSEWILFGKHRIILNNGSLMVHNKVLSLLGSDQIVNYQVLQNLNLYCLADTNWVSYGTFTAPPFNHENHNSQKFHNLSCPTDKFSSRLLGSNTTRINGPSIGSKNINSFFNKAKRDVASLFFDNLLLVSAVESNKVLAKNGLTAGFLVRHIQDISLTRNASEATPISLEILTEYRSYYLLSFGMRVLLNKNFTQYGPTLRVDLTNPASYYKLGAKQKPFNYSLHGDLLIHMSKQVRTTDNNFFVFRAGFTVDYFPVGNNFFFIGNILGLIKQKNVEASAGGGLGYEF